MPQKSLSIFLWNIEEETVYRKEGMNDKNNFFPPCTKVSLHERDTYENLKL